MKIYFERTGGFAGLRLAVNLDLDYLPTEDAGTLQKLVEEADLFHLPEPVAGPGVVDGFQYAITVERKGEQRTFQVGDDVLPAGLRPLINDLTLRARSHRG
jgi:hypothetical protein